MIGCVGLEAVEVEKPDSAEHLGSKPADDHECHADKGVGIIGGNFQGMLPGELACLFFRDLLLTGFLGNGLAHGGRFEQAVNNHSPV